jgi:hypothetical protein
MACIVDGKLFDLAYLFLKHMGNVIKGMKKKALMYRAILTKIFIAFNINVLEYEDGKDIRRDHIYNAIKFKKITNDLC